MPFIHNFSSFEELTEECEILKALYYRVGTLAQKTDRQRVAEKNIA